MTIDEAIKDIKENIQPSVGGLSLEMAIQALEEIEEYRVKEFQCHLAHQEGISIGYNKAIDEAIETVAKAICVDCGCLEGHTCTYKGSNCKVSKHMLEVVVKTLEQMKAGLK